MSDHVHFMELPLEIQHAVAQHLSASDLGRLGSTCRLLASVARDPALWRGVCVRENPALASVHLVNAEDWKALCRAVHDAQLAAEREEQLRACIVGAIDASSTDHEDSENISNTLDMRVSYDIRESSYWSSKGNPDVNSIETLDYKTAPLAIVRHASIKVYQALWQDGEPIYAPKRVRFFFGAGPPSEDRWTTVAGPFDVERTAERQRFGLGPRGTLAVGGVLRVALEGRTQVQREDGLYYTCISLVLLAGTPVQGFTSRLNPASGRLEVVRCRPDQPRAESPLPLYQEPEPVDRRAAGRFLRLLRRAAAAGVPQFQLLNAYATAAATNFQQFGILANMGDLGNVGPLGNVATQLGH